MDSALPKPSKKGEELKGSKKMTKGLASTKGKRKRLLVSCDCIYQSVSK